jgi:hypothetical protein
VVNPSLEELGSSTPGLRALVGEVTGLTTVEAGSWLASGVLLWGNGCSLLNWRHWRAWGCAAVVLTLAMMAATAAGVEVAWVVRAMLSNNHGGRSTLLSGSEARSLVTSLVESELRCLSLPVHFVALILLTDCLIYQLLEVSIIPGDQLVGQLVIQAC